MKYIKYMFIAINFLVMSCKSQEVVSVKYFKDFNLINVTGIEEVTQSKLTFPYLKMSTYKDSSIIIDFFINDKESFTKKYFYENGILVSRLHLKTIDAGCNGFDELQYYFEKNKMITYVFCDSVNFKNKHKIYKVYSEETIIKENAYSYKHKSAVLQSFYDDKIIPAITFNPKVDYDGTFYSEIGALINENFVCYENDSVHEISKSYYNAENNERQYVSNNNFIYKKEKYRISIWNDIDPQWGF